jgi:hypothetical protein
MSRLSPVLHTRLNITEVRRGAGSVVDDRSSIAERPESSWVVYRCQGGPGFGDDIGMESISLTANGLLTIVPRFALNYFFASHSFGIYPDRFRNASLHPASGVGSTVEAALNSLQTRLGGTHTDSNQRLIYT